MTADLTTMAVEPRDTLSVGVVGAGYVGLTSAACLAHLGHRVACVDVDHTRIAALRRGRVPIAEPGLVDLVRQGTAEGRLTFHTDHGPFADTDVVLMCVPTPMGVDGAADLDALHAAVRSIGPTLRPGCVLVVKSTVPVGTTRDLEKVLDRADIPVVSNPEFLREGRAVEDFLNPDRVVVGSDDSSAADAIDRLYRRLPATVLRTDPPTAELAKYACNAFLAMKLSYVNTLAQLCGRVGASIDGVTAAMSLDSRIGPAFLSSGPGWGGSCLPKDVAALLSCAGKAGVDLGMVREALAVNDDRIERTARRIIALAGGSVAGVRIGLLGLTFKADTDDLRRSPAVDVAEFLAAAGARLTAYDPAVPSTTSDTPGSIRVVDDPVLVADGAAVVVVLTEWARFTGLDWAAMAARTDRATVLDTRRLLDRGAVEAAGWTYRSIDAD